MNKFYLHIDGIKNTRKKTWCLQLKYNEHLITKRCDGWAWRIVIVLLWLIPLIIVKNLFGKKAKQEIEIKSKKIEIPEILKGHVEIRPPEFRPEFFIKAE
jgi:hypothetical protein